MRVNDKGEPLKIEVLMFEPVMERIVAPYVKNLKLLGIDARIRNVDPAQYQQRLKDFDFDITTQRYSMRNTPGVELRSYFGSQAADLDGSLNLAGIKDPAVDALIERVVAAKTREDMTTAARALDRVLRAGHYWVPHWYKASNTVAYWDKFSRPETKPKYDRGILDTWWFDTAKAAALSSKPAATGAGNGEAADNGSSRSGRSWAGSWCCALAPTCSCAAAANGKQIRISPAFSRFGGREFAISEEFVLDLRPNAGFPGQANPISIIGFRDLNPDRAGGAAAG